LSDILDKRAEWHSQCRVKLLGEDNSNTIADTTLDFWSDLAERLIKAKATDWATLLTAGGNDKEYLIDATISMLCAMYVTPLKNQMATDIKVGEIAVKKELDFDSMELDFYGEVEFLLGKISTYTMTTITRVGKITNTEIFEAIEN